MLRGPITRVRAAPRVPGTKGPALVYLWRYRAVTTSLQLAAAVYLPFPLLCRTRCRVHPLVGT